MGRAILRKILVINPLYPNGKEGENGYFLPDCVRSKEEWRKEKRSKHAKGEGKSDRLIGAVETSEAWRMTQASTEKLEHNELAEWERVTLAPQIEHLARTLDPPLPKRKSKRASCPNNEIPRMVKVKMG